VTLRARGGATIGMGDCRTNSSFTRCGSVQAADQFACAVGGLARAIKNKAIEQILKRGGTLTTPPTRGAKYGAHA
jgi:hypothetical protein